MNATIKIEKEYKEFLNTLKARNYTADTIKNDYFTYNDAAEKTFEYLSKVALLSVRNRSLINATGYDFDMYASDITMHLLNKKLDGILSCDNDGVIPYIIQAVNWQVIDMFRKWKREYPDVKKKSVKGSNSNNNELEKVDIPEFNSVINFLDDVAWSLIADDIDIEEDIIRQENMAETHATVLKALANSSACSRFELVCLLATKVITNSNNRCMKTRALAEAIDKIGLNTVSEACFETAAAVFEISHDTYFSHFTSDYVPAYSSIEELCDKISKASNNCAVKLCKKMGATRATKKRVQK